MAHKRAPQLTDRQREIAYLLAGRTYEGIGRQLGISPRTVKYHVDNMRTRFGLDSKIELIAFLREHDYID